MLGFWCEAIRHRDFAVRPGRLAPPGDSDSPSMEWQRARGVACYDICRLRRQGRNFPLYPYLACELNGSFGTTVIDCGRCKTKRPKSRRNLVATEILMATVFLPLFTFSSTVRTFRNLNDDVGKQGGQSVPAVGSRAALRLGWHHRHRRQL